RVDEREVDHPCAACAWERLERPRRDPRRHPFRRLLLEERRPGEPFPPALHRERPVAQVRQERRRDRVVVGRELALRDPVLWEEDAAGMGKLDPAHPTSACTLRRKLTGSTAGNRKSSPSISS